MGGCRPSALAFLKFYARMFLPNQSSRGELLGRGRLAARPLRDSDTCTMIPGAASTENHAWLRTVGTCTRH